MSKQDVTEEILEKVQCLDPDDEVRRGILERIADWWLARKTSHRAKHWKRVEEQAEYLKY